MQEIDSKNGESREAEKPSNDGVKKAEPSENGHLRVGWSTPLADLQAPVGYNEHSYAVRDIAGSRIHKSRREDKWGGAGFGPGDVVGVAICLAGAGASAAASSATNATTTAAGSSLAAAADAPPESKSEAGHASEDGKAAPAAAALTDHIRFFKNGKPMGGPSGVAFDGILPGTYHPAVSCYMDASARVNFGPHFVYPPSGLPDGLELRPVSELCPSPPLPEEAVERVMSSGRRDSGGGGGGGKDGRRVSSYFAKRTDDGVVLAYRELVRAEATVRRDSYARHLDLHRGEVAALRRERGLPASDVESCAPPAVEQDAQMS